ncbi:hypothetical protein SAMN05421774_10447 [Gemmobacter megaterium]|uniref:Uncharacterized protein n=1 Tax=Gemmobacter megaterium TaxID=1086013 RepID=A0A1N7NQ75_9RHOB|nr:hypothetical protein GCM10011345_24050 [Gemmobacter megaterium]SIT00388.1 hypothetical protein SAMN05421774_10447 [Gemmobacter megaterium]
MTRWLQAARAAKAALPPGDKTDTTDATQSMGEVPHLSAQPEMVVSVVSVLSEGGMPRPKPSAPAPSRLDGPVSIGIVADTPRALCSVTDRPMTWTGKVVSLDAWRRLSAWDRHGPELASEELV